MARLFKHLGDRLQITDILVTCVCFYCCRCHPLQYSRL